MLNWKNAHSSCLFKLKQHKRNSINHIAARAHTLCANIALPFVWEKKIKGIKKIVLFKCNSMDDECIYIMIGVWNR